MDHPSVEHRESPLQAHKASTASRERPYYFDTAWRLGSAAVWNVLAFGLVIGLAVMLITMTGGNIRSEFLSQILLSRVLIIMLVALPTVQIMASGGLDLSIGAVASLASMITLYFNNQGAPAAGILLALGVGLALGLIHTLLVGAARMHGVLVTLATASLLQGLTLTIFQNELVTLQGGPTSGPGLYLGGWLLAGVGLVVGIVLVQFTPFGHRPQPGEKESRGAHLLYAGLPYLASGFMAAVAGMLMAGIYRLANPATGSELQFEAVLAAVIGGSVLGGGFGSPFGVVPGALAAVLLQQIGGLLQMDRYIAVYVTKGAVLLVAIILAYAYRGLVALLYRGRRSPAPAPAETGSP